MKKIDQYLLENYPTIWNTKILWMILTSLIIHILSFFIGIISHATPTSLHGNSALHDYFTYGLFFGHLIISLLILVIWLVTMFRNNAFKNFYPTSRWKLFSQFVQYFTIILFSTTFYYSYVTGLKLFINTKYDDNTMSKKIESINKGAVFLSQTVNSYTLDNRKYPGLFNDLYCERNDEKIDFSQPYFTFLDHNYQYYSTYPKIVYQKDENGEFIIPESENLENLAYTIKKENSKTYYFKKKIEDINRYVSTSNPSYYNFSEVFYYTDKTQNNRNYTAYKAEVDTENPIRNREGFRMNKITNQLLDQNNLHEIELVLKGFLEVSKEFKIPTNLDEKTWTKLVYQPKKFEVTHFIKKYNPIPGEEYPYQYGEGNTNGVLLPATADGTIEEAQKIDLSEKFFNERITDYYFNSSDLTNTLENIDEIKNTDVFSESIHVFLWIAFGLSAILFCFRIAGLKSLLFSILTTWILQLSIALICVLFFMGIEIHHKELVVMYFIWVISTIILLLPIFALRKMKKNISAVLMNITICGFVLYIFLYFMIINEHQKINCLGIQNCFQILEYLDLNLSYILLFIGFLFMYLYTIIIQKWKALPSS